MAASQSGISMRPVVCAAAAAVSCLLAGLASPASAEGPTVDLDAILRSVSSTGPGCAAGAAVAGAPVLTAAYGQADLEHPAPLTPDSVFESGSLAKQFTAAALLLLAQDGKLTLDDDIRRHLPEMPDYGTPITIRHLLNHTSGLREQWSLLALAGNPPGTQVHSQEVILDLASRQKGLNFTPGAEFLYANTNYTLAAIIIQRASGQSVQQFTERRLFQPLGMGQTRWREDFRTVVPGRATAYAPDGDGFIANMPFTNVYGNGGLLTTIGDLLRWNAFLDRPSSLPGGQALVAALQTPGRLSDGSPIEYALGVAVTRAHGLRLVSHSGSTGGYKTWLGRYPDQGISVAVLCNNGGVDAVALGERIADQTLRAAGHAVDDPAAPSPPAAAAPMAPPRDLTPYQGLFRNPVTGELARIDVVDGRLAWRQGASQPLVPLGGQDFRRADGDPVRFVVADGRPIELRLGEDARARRFVAMSPAQGGDALAAYVGTYYSTELDTRITVVRKGDALVMRQPFGVEWPLTPSFADGFSTRLRGTTTFVFSRAADGQVNGFAAWANAARDIPFVKE